MTKSRSAAFSARSCRSSLATLFASGVASLSFTSFRVVSFRTVFRVCSLSLTLCHTHTHTCTHFPACPPCLDEWRKQQVPPIGCSSFLAGHAWGAGDKGMGAVRLLEHVEDSGNLDNLSASFNKKDAVQLGVDDR